MIPIRHAPQASENEELKEITPQEGETNSQWLARANAQDGLLLDRKSTRLNSSHIQKSRMPSSA